MSETQATRLTQSGHDRVYIKLTETGEQIGWLDLKTDTVTVDAPLHTTALLAAATNWRASNTPSGWSVKPPATAATTIGALPPPLLPNWAAPVGLPIPLPHPLAPPAASDDWPVNVAVELSSLPVGWHALPSEHIEVEGSGFEYIVIGPAGVFTVTTVLHHRERIGIDEPLVDDDATDQYLQNSRFEAERATRLLDQAGLVDIQVQAAIVLVDTELTIHTVSDVIVAAAKDICRTLLSLPATLTPLQVQSVYKIADRSDTWIERTQPKG